MHIGYYFREYHLQRQVPPEIVQSCQGLGATRDNGLLRGMNLGILIFLSGLPEPLPLSEPAQPQLSAHCSHPADWSQAQCAHLQAQSSLPLSLYPTRVCLGELSWPMARTSLGAVGFPPTSSQLCPQFRASTTTSSQGSSSSSQFCLAVLRVATHSEGCVED